MTTEFEPLSREQLYDLVWRQPMLKVGEKYGVSSSYLARVCTELRVPRPERGYWSKLEFGKAEPRPALPPAQPGDVTEWSPGATVGTRQRTVAHERRTRTPAAVAGVAPIDQRHELLVGVKPLFLKTRDSDIGLLRPYKRLLVDVLSSQKHLDVTLDAADALFRALTARGHRVMLAPPGTQMRREEVDERESPKNDRHHRTLWAPDRSTVVYVGDVPIGLTIFEMTESVEMLYMGSSKYVPVRDLTVDQLRRHREPHHWRTTKDFASGRLAVQAYSTAWRVKWCERWQEAKAGQFSSLTSKVAKALELAAPELARKYEEAERQAEEELRKWEESRRRAEEEAERACRERARQESRRDLLAAIASWEQARSIDAYFQAVERETEQLPEADREHLLGRLAEARSLVGQLDALGPLRTWKAPLER